MTSVPLQFTFVTSAKRYSDLPPTPCEAAFVGRSNVGKSSVINALANRRQLARVSNTPGRTQLLNMFVLPSGGTVVDLPGYGYAKVPGRERSTWQAMIEAPTGAHGLAWNFSQWKAFPSIKRVFGNSKADFF